MQLGQVLDVIEGVLVASQHPDIAEIRRYGTDTAPGGQSPAGVAVRWVYGDGATSYLAGSALRIESAVPTPEELPPPRAVLARLPVFVVRLLDVARPTAFQSWRLVAIAGIGPTGQQGQVPAGVGVVGADGSKFVLHSTYGSGQTKEPETDPHPEYQIPSEVKEWHLKASAQSAGPA